MCVSSVRMAGRHMQLLTFRCNSYNTNITVRSYKLVDTLILNFHHRSAFSKLIQLCPHREHDQVFRKPRQPAVSYSYDHSWPGERGQGLAPGKEPWTWRPEGGWPWKQDGLRDLPDTAFGYQGEPSMFLRYIGCAFIQWSRCMVDVLQVMQ